MAVAWPTSKRQNTKLHQDKVLPTWPWHSVGSRKHKIMRMHKTFNRAPRGIRSRTHTVHHADADKEFCVVFNVRSGLTNGTLAVPIFQGPLRNFTVDVGGGVRTPADGIVNQKHSRRDRSVVGCEGVFDL